MKLCECGCGTPTKIATKSSSRDGVVAGKPKRFLAGHQSRVVKKIEPSIRFWAMVDKTPGFGPKGDCWEWTGSRRPETGHGSFWPAHERMYAHRFSWQLHYGDIPEGLSVLHRCDNGPCVNPAHLFLGTLADNNRDRNSKGRQAKGSSCGRAKVNESDVLEMRRLYQSGIGHKRIAKQFGVSGHSARMAVLGRTWKHLNGVQI